MMPGMSTFWLRKSGLYQERWINSTRLLQFIPTFSLHLFRCNLKGINGSDVCRIAHGQPGGVGIAAITDNLDFYRFGGLHLGGKVAWDNEGDHGASLVEFLLQSAIIVVIAFDGKIGRTLKETKQFPALGSA